MIAELLIHNLLFSCAVSLIFRKVLIDDERKREREEVIPMDHFDQGSYYLLRMESNKVKEIINRGCEANEDELLEYFVNSLVNLFDKEIPSNRIVGLLDDAKYLFQFQNTGLKK